MTTGRTLFLAATIGISVSVIANGSMLAMTSYRPETDEWLAFALLGAFPFNILTACGFRGRLEWLVSLALTVVAWGTYLVIGIPQLATVGSVDMGPAFLVMTSPIWIAVLGVAVGFSTRSHRQAR